jgi:hypothetical protein
MPGRRRAIGANLSEACSDHLHEASAAPQTAKAEASGCDASSSLTAESNHCPPQEDQRAQHSPPSSPACGDSLVRDDIESQKSKRLCGAAIHGRADTRIHCSNEFKRAELSEESDFGLSGVHHIV